MKLSICYLAQLKMAAGSAGDQVDIAAAQPVGQVLAAIASRHGDNFRQLLLTAEGNLQPSLLLFLGDEQITAGDLVPRRDGDVLTVLSPMAGG